MTTQESAMQLMREMLADARTSMQSLIDEMPDSPMNDGQYALAAKHGTPKQFAKSVTASLGEISITEARDAIQEYRRRWRNA